MHIWGYIANTLTVIVGSLLGLLIGARLSDSIKKDNPRWPGSFDNLDRYPDVNISQEYFNDCWFPCIGRHLRTINRH